MINEQITQGVISSAKTGARLLSDLIRFMEMRSGRKRAKYEEKHQKERYKDYKKEKRFQQKVNRKSKLSHKDLLKYSKDNVLDKKLVNSEELKELKKYLKKLGVKFSILKFGDDDKKLLTFQAKDKDTLNYAYGEVLKKFKKEKIKSGINRDFRISYTKNFKSKKYKKVSKIKRRPLKNFKKETLEAKIKRIKNNLPKIDADIVKNIKKVK